MMNQQNCTGQDAEGLHRSSQVSADQLKIEKPAAGGTTAGSEFCEVNRGHSMSNDSTRTHIRKVNVTDENFAGGWAGYFDACENQCLTSAFNALVKLGMKPVPLEATLEGKIKKPIGKDWGKLSIEKRRNLLCKAIGKKRDGTGLGCQPFGYVVFDLDPPDKDPARIQETIDDFIEVMLCGEIVETLVVKGERGVHYWFKANEDFLKQFGGKKREFKMPSGGHIEVFVGSEESQMQVACAPSRGKHLYQKVPPCPVPEPLMVFMAEARQGNATNQTTRDHKTVERKATPSPSGSKESNWFLDTFPHILHGIRTAKGGELHPTLRRRIRSVAGYAAATGCEHFKEKVFEVATENLEANGGCESFKVAKKTMKWAWDNGVEAPSLPTDWESNNKKGDGKPERKPVCSPSELLKKQGKIDRKPPLQLIPGFLEMNQCQIVGFMGAGKGAISSLIAAHITTGKSWWTGDSCLAGSVLMFSAEDSTAVMEYRCKAAGANVCYGADDAPRNSVICFGSGHEALMDSDGLPLDLTDTGWLDQWRGTLPDLKAIIIDPIKSFCGQRGPSQSEEDHVRAKMTKTLTWASKHRIAVICVIQPAKGSRNRHIDEMASGSLAWSAVTRSIICLEENIHYGQQARVLLAGRQSNSSKGKPTIFDLEVVHARDFEDQPVYTPEDGKPVMVPVLKFRQQIEPQDYIVPPDERATPEKNSPRKVLDWEAIRIAACETIETYGGRMQSIPSDDEQSHLGDPQDDERWLGFVCGHLARRFKASPRTIKNKLYDVFTSNMERRIKVPGWICGLEKDGFGGSWLWTAKKDPTAKQSGDVSDSPPF